MANAVIYARYSSDKQTEQSIEGQLRDCHAFAKAQGHTVIAEYIDRARSGKNDNREEFQRMIADSSKKQFQYIIVYKLDRFSRNRYDSAVYKHKLEKYGVRVISATEPISDTGESRIVEALFEAMAEEYLITLSDNVKRGLREAALKGYATGGNLPLGYKIEDKRLATDESLVPTIKWLFEAYAQGMTKTKIAAELNARGVKTTRGNPININIVTSMINNPIYTGKHSFKGEIERECPAIISEDLFEQCKQRSKASSKQRGRRSEKAADYLLTGKLFCGMCGSTMTGDCATAKNGERHYYYTCHGRKRHKNCKKKSERKGYIEWYIVEQTVEYVLSPNRLQYIAERVAAELNKKDDPGQVRDMERQAKAADKAIAECVNTLYKTTSKAAIEIINARLLAEESRKTELQALIAQEKNKRAIATSVTDIEAWLKSFLKGDPLDEPFRRKVIDAFINSVYLYDDKVVIYFNAKDCKQVSYIEMIESSAEPDYEYSDWCGCGLPKTTL